MKGGTRAISALLIIAFLVVPALPSAQQLAKPIDRSVFPGVTTLQYANQTLVFTTPVALRVKLEVLPSGVIQLRFKAQTSTRYGLQSSTAAGQAVIFWQQASEELYNGVPPDDWIDVPFGEGGWTEK